MMKFLSVAILLFVATLTDAGAARVRPSVFGRWLTDDGSGIVEIGSCGREVCGTLVRILNPAAPARDINNPDAKLRSRPLLGIAVLSGLKPDSTIWKGGQAYDPKVGGKYRASIKLGADGRLNVTGCILFLCRTRYWTRINPKDDT